MSSHQRPEHCFHCGKKTDNLTVITYEGAPYYVCEDCREKLQPPEVRVSKMWTPIYPELIFRGSPLRSLVVRVFTRDAITPFGISLTKEEKSEGEEGEGGITEIDWGVLTGGYEPVDELSKKSLAHILASKFAEENGVITAKDLAKYLSEMVSIHPELEEYLMRFKEENEDAARHVLNELSDMGFLIKEARKGERGANVYYYNYDKSWRKD